MGSFEDHMESASSSANFPAVLVGLLSFVFTESVVYSLAMGVGTIFFVHIGAALPDIDHHSSIPFKKFRSLVGMSFGIVVLYFLSGLVGQFVIDGWNFTTGIVDISTIGSSILAYNFGRALGGILILVPILFYSAIALGKWVVESLRPKHRGPTHSPLFGVVTSIVLGVIVWWGSSLFISPVRATGVGTIIAVSNFTGVLDHLSFDNML